MTKPTIAIVALGVALLAGPALADDDDHIRSAENDLRSAREHLKAATHDYGGHRKQALERINNALDDLGAALKVSARDDRKDEKKVNQLDHKINKLENQKKKIEGN